MIAVLLMSIGSAW